MKMKSLIYISIFSIVVLSCNLEAEEEITWDLGEHPDMLVVESIITNELKNQEVKLTISNPYFETSVPEDVSGAIVSVNDGTKTIQFLESSEQKGLYISEYPFACEPLRNYNLKIVPQQPINGLSEYNSISKMPEGQEMDSVECEIYALPELDFMEEEDTAILVVYYFGREPMKSENFYFTKTSINGELIGKNPKEYNYFRRSYENTGYVFIDSYLKNINHGDVVHFRLYTIEENYYRFLEALKMMDSSGSAMSMSGPPANAVGNISNGKGLGYFLAAYVSEKTGIAKDMR